MDRLSISALTVSLGLVIPGVAGAHIGDRIFPLFELTDEDVKNLNVRDGHIADWEEAVGEPNLLRRTFSPIRWLAPGLPTIRPTSTTASGWAGTTRPIASSSAWSGSTMST